MPPILLFFLFSKSFYTMKNGLIIALAIGFLCLFLIIVLTWIYLAKRITKRDVKNIIKDSLRNRGSVYKEIANQLLYDENLLSHFSNQEHSSDSLSKEEVERIVQQKLDKFLESYQTRQPIEFVQSPCDSPKPNLENSNTKKRVLYATCVDDKGHGFYSVTEQPDKDTIFVLELNQENTTEATFEVFDKVYKKVIEEQGHLKDGCVVVNPDMNNTLCVRTIEPGLASFRNGTWEIIQQAKVKFE